MTRVSRSLAALLFLLIALPARSIDLVDAQIPSFPDGVEPTFNTTSFDIGNYRYLYSARAGAHGKILVNQQNMTTGSWVYVPSRIAVDMNLYDTAAIPSVALGTVLQAPTGQTRFLNPLDGSRYKYVMYFIYQGTKTPNSAGVVCLSYSGDALAWTVPVYAVRSASSPRGTRCGIDAGNASYVVQAEAVSGFLLSTSSIHLWHLEGDLSILESDVGSLSKSHTYYDRTSANTPDVLQQKGQITLNGVSGLNRPGGTFQNYFANLDATYNPSSGLLYLLRVYPAPYDSSDLTTPCNPELFPGDFKTIPSHGQAYSMPINGDPAQSINASNTWTQVAEFGQFVGLSTLENGVCRDYRVRTCIPDNEFMFNVGARPNLNMVSVHKTPEGWLALDAQGLAVLYLQTVDRHPAFVDIELMTGKFSTVHNELICVNFQVGTAALTHESLTLQFNGFHLPIVVMGPPTFAGTEPGNVRVELVSPVDFRSHFNEWAYLNGAHVSEGVPFLVMEKGQAALGGLRADAGETQVSQQWKTVSFGQSFPSVPVVLAQTASSNDSQPVTTRIRNVGTTGFQIRLQEEEAADNIHTAETVHWIAIEPGTVTIGKTKLVVGRTGDTVTHTFSTISFGTTVTNPAFLAAMQTFDGGDPATLRSQNLTTASVEIRVEEETSADAETNHTTEIVGYVVASQ